MTTDDSQNWFVRLDMDTIIDLSINCPRCKNPYAIGLFDEEFRECMHCKATLVEWNLIRFIYLVDIEKSPKVIQNLAHYIRTLNASEGFKQLVILHDFLGVGVFD